MGDLGDVGEQGDLGDYNDLGDQGDMGNLGDQDDQSDQGAFQLYLYLIKRFPTRSTLQVSNKQKCGPQCHLLI